MENARPGAGVKKCAEEMAAMICALGLYIPSAIVLETMEKDNDTLS
jgi:hypothetical protein